MRGGGGGASANALEVHKYIQHWRWDESKYPVSRSITDNLNSLMHNVHSVDDAARSKLNAYNEMKAQKAILQKTGVGTYATRELVDVILPALVRKVGAPGTTNAGDDFIESVNLGTVLVV